MGRGNKVLGMATDLKGIHDQAKGAVGGRWPKFSRYIGPQYFAKSSDALNAYIAERQFKVGRVKAGWAAVMQQVPKPVTKKGVERNFGTYDAPWVDANKRSAQGVFSASRSPGFVSITVMNLIGNINNVASESGTENIVYRNRVKQMRTAVQEYFYPTIKKANKRRK
jgi:hypothetical protein